jgi:hypothetical protein
VEIVEKKVLGNYTKSLIKHKYSIIQCRAPQFIKKELNAVVVVLYLIDDTNYNFLSVIK